MEFNFKLGIIGYGNMSSAILNGIFKSNLLSKSEILIYDIDNCKKKELAQNHFCVAETNVEIIKKCEYVLLAVKPQFSDSIFEEVKNFVNDNIFISIMAGVQISTIQKKLGKNVKVARCMPNTPCKIGLGMCAVDTSMLSESEEEFVLRLFKSTGESIKVDESALHAVTSISGSGPAYVYYFINAMIESGVKNGLTYEQSKTLTIQTFLGASEMVRQSDEKISDLISAVCSKGGTTIQAVDYFRSVELEKYIEEGIDRCYMRSVELGNSK